MRLKDKIAIVTGAASVLGRATSILFAREGARLVVNDLDDRRYERGSSRGDAAWMNDRGEACRYHSSI